MGFAPPSRPSPLIPSLREAGGGLGRGVRREYRTSVDQRRGAKRGGVSRYLWGTGGGASGGGLVFSARRTRAEQFASRPVDRGDPGVGSVELRPERASVRRQRRQC